jgi:hypothetical protein
MVAGEKYNGERVGWMGEVYGGDGGWRREGRWSSKATR